MDENKKSYQVLERIIETQKKTIERKDIAIKELIQQCAVYRFNRQERINNVQFKLTPKESRICEMIKNNVSNVEISKLLKITFLTLQKHRSNIRKKLGLTNNKTRLNGYISQIL